MSFPDVVPNSVIAVSAAVFWSAKVPVLNNPVKLPAPTVFASSFAHLIFNPNISA